MMKRKSVIILLLTLFWFAYLIFTFVFYVYNTKAFYHEAVENRKAAIDLNINNAAFYLATEKHLSLLPRLEQAAQLKQIDFYILKQGDSVLGFYNTNQYLKGIDVQYPQGGQFYESDNVVLKSLEILNYKLTIGINKREKDFLWDELWARRGLLAKDILFVSVIVFFVAQLVLRDILEISHVLQGKRRQSIKGVRTLSREAETLMKAASGYEATTLGLQTSNEQLSGSLGPAISAEIATGKKTPYVVSCTLARIDLNGYTQMYLSKEKESLFYLLNEYFQKSRDIIERYGGLIYQIIGDEIICIFKSEDPNQSVRKAMSAVRNLFEVTQKISTPSISEGLRLKASLASGDLQFIKLDKGYSFSGLPLIESVRMLGQVSEKNESRLIVFNESISALEPLCTPLQTKTAVFKGFDRESQLLEIKEFTSIEKAFGKIPLSEIGMYFKSDSDLVFILKKLKSFIQENNQDSFFSLTSSLRNLKMTQSSSEVLSAYKEVIAECLNQKLDQLPESRMLATVVSLSRNFLVTSQIDAWMRQILDRCEEATDPRVSANTLSVKSNFQLPSPGLTDKFLASSNRLAAEAILLSGKSEMTPQIIESVRVLLNSSNPQHIQSGLYVISSLYEYHRNKDLVYAQTNPHLRDLINLVSKFTKHPQPAVRLRAESTMEIFSEGSKHEI